MHKYVTPDGGAYTWDGGINFIHSALYSELSACRDVSQYRMGNIFDPDFHPNQKDIVCSMPCNLACDRDTAIIRPVLKENHEAVIKQPHTPHLQLARVA